MYTDKKAPWSFQCQWILFTVHVHLGFEILDFLVFIRKRVYYNTSIISHCFHLIRYRDEDVNSNISFSIDAWSTDCI